MLSENYKINYKFQKINSNKYLYYLQSLILYYIEKKITK